MLKLGYQLLDTRFTLPVFYQFSSNFGICVFTSVLHRSYVRTGSIVILQGGRELCRLVLQCFPCRAVKASSASGGGAFQLTALDLLSRSWLGCLSPRDRESLS